MLVSEFLKQNGVDPTNSALLKKYGDSVIYPAYMSQEEKQSILNIEKQLPAIEKELAEADTRNKNLQSERAKKNEIQSLLHLEVQKAFPKSSYQEIFRDVHEAHTKMVAVEMMEKAQFEVDGSTLVINGQKNDSVRTPTNDLERVLQKSKISFHKPVTMEDIVQKTFGDNGGYSFLIR